MEVHLPVEDYLQQQSKIISENSYFRANNMSKGTMHSRIEDDKVHEGLIKHDYEIREIKNILGSIVETQKISAEKMTTLAEGISRMDTVIEKLSNIDSKYTESINRIHKRIDEKEQEIKGLKDVANDYRLTKKEVEELVEGKKKIVWGILTAIGLGVLQLVMK